MITYYDLGPDKRLNEIVMAGSHDAGVTGGKGNVQTQNLDVGGQALAGVRVFDLRITGASVKKGDGGEVVALKAYHDATGKAKVKQAIDLRTGQTRDIKVFKLGGGAFGLSLTKILNDAKNFVTTNASEFLILKFDKCHNWQMIAEACVSVLGATIYRMGGNLNNKTLRDLQGKVIVLFTKDGIEAVHHLYGPPHGILGIKNLYEGGAVRYEETYHGLQYYGKGGTSPFNPFSKLKQNVKSQRSKMEKGGQGNPNVMGMMYWTTTGLLESIRDRNTNMWTPPNVARLKNMWENGMNSAVMGRVGALTRIDGFAGGQQIKAFLPNIVMIDFADTEKCEHIFELNTVPVTFLVSALGDYTHA